MNRLTWSLPDVDHLCSLRTRGRQLGQVHVVRPALETVAALFAVLVVGACETSVSHSVSKEALNNSETSLPVVSGEELGTLIQRSDRPLLIEFGVNSGCYRCEQMRSEIPHLIREIEDMVDVARVDFNTNRQLAAQFGVFICPSYVLFNQGQVVARQSFPTSADLLLADLERKGLTQGHDE